MWRRSRRFFLHALWAGLAPLSAAAGEKSPDARGQEIALAAEQRNDGFSAERAAFTLILIDSQGERAERRLTIEVLEDGSRGSLSRVGFDSPAGVRGTTLLTHSSKAGDDQQWLYLPATKRARRISAGHRTGSFMGSEFTYEDLAAPVAAKYIHKLLGEESFAGAACYLLERKPKVSESGYSRQVVWLDKQRLVPHKVEFFDRRNELLKVGLYKDYRAHGKHHRPELVRMENRQTKKVSELKATSRELGVALDRRRFESQSLGD